MLNSRKVVGWSIDSQQASSLVTNALSMAIEQRDAIRGTVIHSDHGTQFTAWSFSGQSEEVGTAAIDGLGR